MGLTFPNSSRSYDSDHGRIRFVGHDGMFQISFSITTDAVSRKRFDGADAERGYLAAFDASRSHPGCCGKGVWANPQEHIRIDGGRHLTLKTARRISADCSNLVIRMMLAHSVARFSRIVRTS